MTEKKNTDQRVAEILGKISRGERISPLSIRGDDRSDPAIMSLIAHRATTDDLLRIIGDTNDPMSEVVLMSADPVAAIAGCLRYAEFIDIIDERHIRSLVVPAFRIFLDEDSPGRITSESDLKVMYQGLLRYDRALADEVRQFAPRGISLYECGD